MKLFNLLPTTPQPPAVIAIGTFDGVHLGHQALLQAAAERCVVLTLDPHPSHTLTPDNPTPLLCPIGRRLDLLEAAGVASTYVLPFTPHLAAQSAEQFLRQLQTTLPFTQLLMGSTARLGHDRLTPGQIAALGFPVHAVPATHLDNAPISSSRIRTHLSQGDLSAVSRCLGRPYSFQGRIVSGHRLGRTLGYPTVNLRTDSLCLPPYGIYATQCRHKDSTFAAMSYLGEAPTVHTQREPLLETNLLEPAPDLRPGDAVEITLYSLLRLDAKFATLTELIAQMDRDKQTAQTYHASQHSRGRTDSPSRL